MLARLAALLRAVLLRCCVLCCCLLRAALLLAASLDEAVVALVAWSGFVDRVF